MNFWRERLNLRVPIGRCLFLIPMAAQELLQQAEYQWRQLADPYTISGKSSLHIGHLVSSAELETACDIRLFAAGTEAGVLVPPL